MQTTGKVRQVPKPAANTVEHDSTSFDRSNTLTIINEQHDFFEVAAPDLNHYRQNNVLSKFTSENRNSCSSNRSTLEESSMTRRRKGEGLMTRWRNGERLKLVDVGVEGVCCFVDFVPHTSGLRAYCSAALRCIPWRTQRREGLFPSTLATDGELQAQGKKIGISALWRPSSLGRCCTLDQIGKWV